MMATIERVSVPELDRILGDEVKALDHGHVRVIDYMGDDGAIVQAARVSYGDGTKTVSEDAGLIRYLLRHRHTTPFEMCEIKLHMRLPLFVARQLIRHRTANVNEYSARYSIVPDLFYIPATEQICEQSKENKQGRGHPVTASTADIVKHELKSRSQSAYDFYKWQLDRGVARETARLNLPVNVYTEWYWKCDLHNLLHFQSLRHDKHAQWEIRVYAAIIDDIIKKWVPITHKAYVDYVQDAHTFSGPEMALLREIWKDADDTKVTDFQLSESIGNREWVELLTALGLRSHG